MQSTYTLHEYSSSAINISLTLSQLGKKNAIAWRNNLNSAQAGKARKQRERGREGEGEREENRERGKNRFSPFVKLLNLMDVTEDDPFFSL